MIAIIITIMVLELPMPDGVDLGFARGQSLPLLGAYLLSFINIGIFWNNHHHMMQAAKQVDGRVLWANNLLLFWLIAVPVPDPLDRRGRDHVPAGRRLWRGADRGRRSPICCSNGR